MMNRRNNIISNIKKYPRYNNHVIKSFITEDISTLKMYNKGKKEISLNPFIKLIIFVLFIVMLQYSCNLDSCKFLRKSNLESMSHLGTERSLAEGEDTVKVNEQSGVRQRNSEEQQDDSVIENLGKGDNVEQGIRREKIDKNEGRNIKERILNIAKGNPQLIIFFIIILLSFISSTLCISAYSAGNTTLNNTSVLLVAISIIFTVVLLIYERIIDKST
ncbi:Plasmodium exported protein, unknown function [Plasmodium relictum]|uniref:Fam-h protein n=1 Tax=Plasmodium relictum TaxID=85471 RepID=A0A1J1GKI4_PLARL|nr:Plasmodium exported protein, unknown function [Plasmodium relictum]CRG85340.1 Plasmodium exported protein, unknown function [Plasmodium relictum]